MEQLLREELAVIKKAKDDLQARNEHQDAEIHDLQVCLHVFCCHASCVISSGLLCTAGIGKLVVPRVTFGAWGRSASAKQGTPLIIHKRLMRIRV